MWCKTNSKCNLCCNFMIVSMWLHPVAPCAKIITYIQVDFLVTDKPCVKVKVSTTPDKSLTKSKNSLFLLLKNFNTDESLFNRPNMRKNKKKFMVCKKFWKTFLFLELGTWNLELGTLPV